jgi:hypothetical protein
MIGPEAISATAEGRRATRGARRARKVKNSRATMNRTERSSISVWVLPFWFCWSTDSASPPVRCMDRPGGAPDEANADRSSDTSGMATLFDADEGRASSTSAIWARPLADVPSSTTAVTFGIERMACSARSTAARSAGVNAPRVDAT